MRGNEIRSAYLPDLIFTESGWLSGTALLCDSAGQVEQLVAADQIDVPLIRLPGRALLPGMVNAHSHAFQRVIRGRTEHRSSNSTDSFWTWREMMYRAARRLSPEDIYDASRMAFLEMALSGITTVGDFHYLHHAPDGTRYDDPNMLAKTVVQAALDVGIRIALLRVAYFRSGFERPPNPDQVRFIEAGSTEYLKNAVDLGAHLEHFGARAWLGLAPHSIRAVPLPELRTIADIAKERGWPLHMHIAEQPAEIDACVAEYGESSVALLAQHGILSERFTGVHGIHITDREIGELAAAGANICACPTTERNLGDGIIPADKLFAAGVSVSLGTDSHAQIDLLEDARELEYHLRLQHLQRNVLAPADEGFDGLAGRLFNCATSAGARSLGFDGGVLTPGRPADFFTVDLNDSAIAGASPAELLTNIVFAGSRSAVREVGVAGKLVVSNGVHDQQAEIVQRFSALQQKLWT